MDVVDAQVHACQEDYPGRPWSPQFAAAHRRLLPQATSLPALPRIKALQEMHMVGVAGAILLSSFHDGHATGRVLKHVLRDDVQTVAIWDREQQGGRT